MNIVLMVAILVLSTMPLLAQDQPDIAKLKADTENVVKIISGDKAKVEAYCAGSARHCEAEGGH